MCQATPLRLPPALLALVLFAACRTASPSLVAVDSRYLHDLTVAVIEAARVRPGESAGGQGPNTTGCTLLRPGGRDDYPAFWIRDYALSLDCGLVPLAEQRALLLLTAAAQPITDVPRQLASGSEVPSGSIPDHITFAGVPIFFPGTIADAQGQGGAAWGRLPPYDDAFLFVHMAACYLRQGGDLELLSESIGGHSLRERLFAAMAMPPRDPDNGLVHATEAARGVNFGFFDCVLHTGDLLFASMLAVEADDELGEICGRLGDGAGAARWAEDAARLRRQIGAVFAQPDGLLRASTGLSAQPDVWGTAFAVYAGALSPAVEARACAALAREYQAGHLAWHGAIRHVPIGADARADSAWERAMAPLGRYQNGAYWSTPTGWVAFALAQHDRALAAQLLRELVEDLRADDFRLGGGHGAPWECMSEDGPRQNPIYMTSVSCALAAVQRLDGRR